MPNDETKKPNPGHDRDDLPEPPAKPDKDKDDKDKDKKDKPGKHISA